MAKKSTRTGKKKAASGPKASGSGSGGSTASRKAKVASGKKAAVTAKPAAAKKAASGKKTAASTPKTAVEKPSKKADAAGSRTKKVAGKKPAGRKVAKATAPTITRTSGPKPSSLSSGAAVTTSNGEAWGEWTPEKLRRVKSGLTQKDRNYFLALLLEKRAELVGDVVALEAARRAQDGDLSHVPLHMADVGSDNYEREFTLGLMESERKTLFDINEAIGRIQDKTYGVCMASGLPIPRPRLEAKPWARYTIEVARERERLGLPV